MKTLNLLLQIVEHFLQTPPPVLETVLVLAGLTLWIGAAGLGAQAAEGRGHQPGRHWLLGLLLPVVYPLGVWFLMKPAPGFNPEELAALNEITEDDAGTVAAEEAEQEAQEEAVAAAAAGVGLVWNKAFFQELAAAGKVSADTPCEIRLRGVVLQVVEILEVKPEFAGTQIRLPDGTLQRMRIPYAGIEAVTPPAATTGESPSV